MSTITLHKNQFQANKNFIDTLNSTINELDRKISTENQFKENIVNLIDSLHIKRKDSNISIPDKDFNKLIMDSQNISQLVDANVNLLSGIKNDYAKLTKVLNQTANFSDEDISNIQLIIEELNERLELMSNTIKFNDNQISVFLKQDITEQFSPAENRKLHSIKTEISRNNNTLLISEKEHKIFLPYSEKEILLYLEQFPGKYISFKNVVEQEFILPISHLMKNTLTARFREGYSLIRDREGKSAFEAFEFAIKIMFNFSLNPAIIAACKTQNQIENYLSCLEHNKLDEFKDFEIKYELNPLSVKHK